MCWYSICNERSKTAIFFFLVANLKQVLFDKEKALLPSEFYYFLIFLTWRVSTDDHGHRFNANRSPPLGCSEEETSFSAAQLCGGELCCRKAVRTAGLWGSPGPARQLCSSLVCVRCGSAPSGPVCAGLWAFAALLSCTRETSLVLGPSRAGVNVAFGPQRKG